MDKPPSGDRMTDGRVLWAITLCLQMMSHKQDGSSWIGELFASLLHSSYGCIMIEIGSGDKSSIFVHSQWYYKFSSYLI